MKIHYDKHLKDNDVLKIEIIDHPQNINTKYMLFKGRYKPSIHVNFERLNLQR